MADPIRVNLTPDQKQQIKKATGADVESLEVTADDGSGPEELEERIAPAFPTISVKVKVTFAY